MGAVQRIRLYIGVCVCVQRVYQFLVWLCSWVFVAKQQTVTADAYEVIWYIPIHIYLCRFGVHLASVTGRWEVVRVLGPFAFDVAFRLCSTKFLSLEQCQKVAWRVFVCEQVRFWWDWLALKVFRYSHSLKRYKFSVTFRLRDFEVCNVICKLQTVSPWWFVIAAKRAARRECWSVVCGMWTLSCAHWIMTCEVWTMSSALCVNLVSRTSARNAKPAPRFRAQLLSREQWTGWKRLIFCCSMRIHELSYVGMGCFTWLFYDLAWWVGYSSVFSFM